MYQLPITALTSAGFYFSTLIFLLSGILLIFLYYFRWKSDFISMCMWLTAYFFSGLFAWILTNDFLSVLIAFGINALLILGTYKLISVISLFGVAFLTSMILPSFYGLIWIYELMVTGSRSLEVGWSLYLFFLFIEIIVSVLVILNTFMLSWIVLVRYSALYFRFPRLHEGWKITDQSEKNNPWISIHVPCFNEPPEIVIETLNALYRLQYPNFEVIVLDNNTSDPAIWQPVERHCKLLGTRFSFYHIDHLAGAKAGALNACLRLTSPQVEIISVMDADYVVQPDFLEKLTGFFNDPKVGFVQACQDYREWKNNRYQSACYFEYETHFKLELSGLNEWDVNYTIGTMCLFRRSVLEQVGGWAEWCLTEDSEVAVRIHALGYTGYYLKDTFGHGLIPETFESYKQQRFRWSAGPAQQFQKHWRLYLPWFAEGRLTLVQKFGEIFHSLSILFSEFLNLFMLIPVLGFCLWFALIKHQFFTVPYVILFFIAATIMRNMICNWLSIKLLGGDWKDYIFSVMAARSLIFTRNMAFCEAWMSKKIIWKRTDKFKASSSFRRGLYSSRSEIIMAFVYIVAASALVPLLNFWKPDFILLIWLGIVNQAISFLCAPMMAFLSEKNLK